MLRKILVGSVILFFMVLIYSIFSLATQKKPRSWQYNFEEYSTDPFGTRVFLKELQNFFPEKKVGNLKSNEFYDHFWVAPELNELNGDSLIHLRPSSTNYFGEIDSSAFNFISVSKFFNSNYVGTNALITHAFAGGNIQIHAFEFNSQLLERLAIEVDMIRGTADTTPNPATQKVIWEGDTFKLRQTRSEEYFSTYPEQVDTLVLNDSGRVMGLKVRMGHGSISLFTMPHIFTNYDLLYVDRTLPEAIVSDLPIKDTFWSKQLNQYEQDEKGLLYFIFSFSTLKWGYYILIFSVLAFFLLNLQRKQKAIPVLAPPKNLSLSFLESISDLHYAQLDYHTILRKKMTFLKSKIKSDYHLHQQEVDDVYIEQLAKRSKIKEESIKRLFKLYNETIQHKAINQAEFETLCNLFQLFKK